ncbi:MAG: septation regulator SpoVG [Clostridia bacterium]|nr:septation regulator SpoVG [Clostridia bacterium]
MKISDVRIRLVQKEDSKLKALASITIDDGFAVHDIKIIQGNEGVFIVMPSRKSSDGTQYKDIAHPINTETRELIKDAILKAYYDELEK